MPYVLYEIPSWTWLAIALGLLLLLTLLTLPLVVLLQLLRTSSNQNQNQQMVTNQLMLTMLGQEQLRVQSLMNQVRAKDLMTLHGLQSATLPEESQSVSPSSNVPEEFAYEVDLAEQGLQLQDLADDLYAAGWDPVIAASNSGGNPTVFDDSGRT